MIVTSAIEPYPGTDKGGTGLSGVLHSHNYPFDYRNSLDCEYSIELHQPDPEDPVVYDICFEFQRFHLEICDTSSGPRDYLEFVDGDENYRYCGKGQTNTASTPENREHVWVENFCCKSVYTEQKCHSFVLSSPSCSCPFRTFLAMGAPSKIFWHKRFPLTSW